MAASVGSKFPWTGSERGCLHTLCGRNIAQMEMILSFQEKEKEYELLKQDDEIKTLELRTTRLFIVMAILGILIVLGVLNYFFSARGKRY